jgi:hypothetical protein
VYIYIYIWYDLIFYIYTQKNQKIFLQAFLDVIASLLNS